MLNEFTVYDQTLHLLEVDNDPSGAGIWNMHGLPRSNGESSASSYPFQKESDEMRYR